jgi:hypothetical protein
MLQYTILDCVKKPFVIYKDTFTNKCCLDPRIGYNENKKAMIMSLPHSGVHLMQEILKLFGLHHVRVNLDQNILYDYRFLSDSDRINFSRLYDGYNFQFNNTYQWVLDGQFICNRVGYNDKIYELLQNSKYVIYLLKRDLRSCLISHARRKRKESNCLPRENNKLMSIYITLPYYKEILETIKILLPWYLNNLFTSIKFEDISCENGKDEQYKQFIQLMEDFEIAHLKMDDVIDKCVNKSTFSFSGNVTKISDYWNDNIEMWFDKIGFKKINQQLGYV